VPTVRDLLARKSGDLISVPGTTTVYDAAMLMVERGIGGLTVAEVGGGLAGIFTERDVLRRVVAENRDPATTLVRDVMTSPVITVTPETSVEECRTTFNARRIRHLPVIGATGLCGIVSSGDVLAFEVAESQTTIRHLQDYVYYTR
jgi:CBS domain-containing protein